MVLRLDRSRRKTVTLPRRIASHTEFVDSICKIRSAMVSRKQEDVEMFVGAMYYFLGWMVGDGIKNLGSRRFLTMRFRLQLTRKHPDNLPLGTYVMDCLGMLGVKCVRGRDGRPRKKVPNGFYAWHSSYSPAVWWLFTACLGLSPDRKRRSIQSGWCGCSMLLGKCVFGFSEDWRIQMAMFTFSTGGSTFVHPRIRISSGDSLALWDYTLG